MSSAEAMQRALTDVVSRGDFTVPPYPGVALRLQRLLAREGYGVGEVAEVIATDAGLATTVLAAANSALAGSGGEITTVGRAVNRLGARTVGSIAIASGVGQLATSSGVLFDVKFRVWRRAISCALCCQKLAPARELDPEDAFLAGLLSGFGRSLAIAALEQLLKTQRPPRPLSVSAWLSIAEQQRAALARAVVESWQLPVSIAEAARGDAASSSPLLALVRDADRVAGELDAGRVPQAAPNEARLLSELLASLPSALQAFAPPPPVPSQRPSDVVAKPERALDGELRKKKAVPVADLRAKSPADITCIAVGPSGIELDSSRPFQESSVVRLAVGAREHDKGSPFEPWFNVVLCSPSPSKRYRIELQLFSPTRELREQWRALYEAP